MYLLAGDKVDGVQKINKVAERVGFEPTVGKPDTRSPGAPDRPLQHLSESLQIRKEIIAIYFNIRYHYYGGEGGIRTHAPLKAETAFRERHHEPLGHLSQPYFVAKLAIVRPCPTRHNKILLIIC